MHNSVPLYSKGPKKLSRKAPSHKLLMRADSFLSIAVALFIFRDNLRSHIWQGLRGVLQRNLQDFVNPFDRFDLKILFDIFRNLLQIANILLRNDHRLDAATVCRQQFFLQPANGQHLATQGDFAGHGHVGTYRNLRQR